MGNRSVKTANFARNRPQIDRDHLSPTEREIFNRLDQLDEKGAQLCLRALEGESCGARLGLWKSNLDQAFEIGHQMLRVIDENVVTSSDEVSPTFHHYLNETREYVHQAIEELEKARVFEERSHRRQCLREIARATIFFLAGSTALGTMMITVKVFCKVWTEW